STPCSSPTIVGSAVASTVWFNDASSIVTISAANSRPTFVGRVSSSSTGAGVDEGTHAQYACKLHRTSGGRMLDAAGGGAGSALVHAGVAVQVLLGAVHPQLRAVRGIDEQRAVVGLVHHGRVRAHLGQRRHQSVQVAGVLQAQLECYGR